MTKPCFPVQWTVYDAKLEKPLVLYTKKGIPICPCNCACIDKYEIHEANEKGEQGKQLGEVKCHFSFPNCGAKAYDADKKELSYLGSNYKVPECIKLCLLNDAAVCASVSAPQSISSRPTLAMTPREELSTMEQLLQDACPASALPTPSRNSPMEMPPKDIWSGQVNIIFLAIFVNLSPIKSKMLMLLTLERQPNVDSEQQKGFEREKS
eukprot:CAMPEP_0114586384 /NCGR_PEP_ID=MMETSP0125-20121206/9630_1 /TAXON_ID=485358 ORGANISM="Aristerostoma sp., Strain ATCC 50986" /NCGR_SAMPLE_ID=MMETSP0125 /ASSEMBLY_ACC=CAM_ASM_000245 /LENGTH=208 /DNA_ID=CAMNT_0001781813 /DNA_START=333 /DNA_END=960 /DNA_ORIENTATION=-